MEYKFTHEDVYFNHYTVVVNGKTVRIHESKSGNGVYINEKDMAKALNFRSVAEMKKTSLWQEIVNKFNAINPENEELEAEIPTQTATPMAASSTIAQAQARAKAAAGEWVEHAGISGIYNGPKSPAFWAGGTLADALEDNTSIVFHMDGSGQVANGNVYWDENGNLTVMGTIESNRNGNRVVIDPVARSLKLMNGNDVRSEWSFSETYSIMKFLSDVSNLSITPGYINMRSNAGKVDINPGSIEVSTFAEDGQTEKTNFSINYMNDSDKLMIIAKYLPISAYGLPSGAIWRDGETLKIVP